MIVVKVSKLCIGLYSKILELEEELKVVGNNMKSLEISEQEVSQQPEFYKEHYFMLYYRATFDAKV